LKGWGINIRGDYRRGGGELLSKIQKQDKEGYEEKGGWDKSKWNLRLSLENKLESLMRAEELY
jgi:hypothetical protein